MTKFDDFPVIESFSKLPKKLIIKAGETALSETGDATLTGIVINNLGQAVRNVQVFLVLFNEKNIPTDHLKVSPDPNHLTQGSLSSFKFAAKGRKESISNYYLHAKWDYVDKDWE